MSIHSDIKNHIDAHGGDYRSWYVGIAADPRVRLFVQHNVNERTDAWIFRDAGNQATARAIELLLLALGCKGGPGGGDHNTRYVYAYRISASTVEAA